LSKRDLFAKGGKRWNGGWRNGGWKIYIKNGRYKIGDEPGKSPRKRRQLLETVRGLFRKELPARKNGAQVKAIYRKKIPLPRKLQPGRGYYTAQRRWMGNASLASNASVIRFFAQEEHSGRGSHAGWERGGNVWGLSPGTKLHLCIKTWTDDGGTPKRGRKLFFIGVQHAIKRRPAVLQGDMGL